MVDQCIDEWCARNGRDPASLELLVAFSHLHGDHYMAVNQFAGRPNTRYMGQTHEEMVGFWGMTSFPEERVTLDLGGREILIWGSPGHVVSEFAYYDSYTQILYTGDMFYRGRCYISFWQPWFDSMDAADRLRGHPSGDARDGLPCRDQQGWAGLPLRRDRQPDEAPVRDDRKAAARSVRDAHQTITEPGIYFTGTVFLCNQTPRDHHDRRHPYRYSWGGGGGGGGRSMRMKRARRRWTRFRRSLSCGVPPASAIDAERAGRSTCPASRTSWTVDGDTLWTTNDGRVEQWADDGKKASVDVPRQAGSTMALGVRLALGRELGGAATLYRHRSQDDEDPRHHPGRPRAERRAQCRRGRAERIWAPNETGGTIAKIDPAAIRN